MDNLSSSLESLWTEISGKECVQTKKIFTELTDHCLRLQMFVVKFAEIRPLYHGGCANRSRQSLRAQRAEDADVGEFPPKEYTIWVFQLHIRPPQTILSRIDMEKVDTEVIPNPSGLLPHESRYNIFSDF